MAINFPWSNHWILSLILLWAIFHDKKWFSIHWRISDQALAQFQNNDWKRSGSMGDLYSDEDYAWKRSGQVGNLYEDQDYNWKRSGKSSLFCRLRDKRPQDKYFITLSNIVSILKLYFSSRFSIWWWFETKLVKKYELFEIDIIDLCDAGVQPSKTNLNVNKYKHDYVMNKIKGSKKFEKIPRMNFLKLIAFLALNCLDEFRFRKLEHRVIQIENA